MRGKRRYQKPTGPPPLRSNTQIRLPEVQLIDDEGTRHGVVETRKALEMAHERGLDLVEVSPKENPPICKIMDLGKHLYKRSKMEREQKTKRKPVDLKGIRLGFKTSEHDLAFKAKNASRFLKKGHKVKIDMRLRGREKALQDHARKQLDHFLTLIDEPYKIMQEPKRNPSGFSIVISK